MPTMYQRQLCMNFALLIIALTGCTPDTPTDEGDSGVPECVEYELDGCMALYPPTYDQVWTQTLSGSCGQAGSACHAQDGSGGAVNGMAFLDPLASWEHMTDEALIVPGDPQCSPLFVRLATDDPEIRMPPGTGGLSPGALCSIGTWIEDGADYSAP